MLLGRVENVVLLSQQLPLTQQPLHAMLLPSQHSPNLIAEPQFSRFESTGEAGSVEKVAQQSVAIEGEINLTRRLCCNDSRRAVHAQAGGEARGEDELNGRTSLDFILVICSASSSLLVLLQVLVAIAVSSLQASASVLKLIPAPSAIRRLGSSTASQVVKLSNLCTRAPLPTYAAPHQSAQFPPTPISLPPRFPTAPRPLFPSSPADLAPPFPRVSHQVLPRLSAGSCASSARFRPSAASPKKRGQAAKERGEGEAFVSTEQPGEDESGHRKSVATAPFGRQCRAPAAATCTFSTLVPPGSIFTSRRVQFQLVDRRVFCGATHARSTKPWFRTFDF